ncbi:protein rep [Pseudonocardia abyssalis]|nr:protein rep [Pseudonocardia abyssalis]
MAWRRSLWEWSSVPRQRKCGRVPFTSGGGAVVRLSDAEDGNRRAGVAGLQSCGSWSCPVCARSISAARAAEVAAVLRSAVDQRCSVALATFTMRHHKGLSLRSCWDAIGSAWRSTTSGAGWQKDKDQFGVVGWLRAVEITHGEEHGFHVHVHALIVFDGPVSVELMGELGHRMFARWNRALGRKGFSAVEDRGGLDVRSVQLDGDSIDQVSTYISKAAYEAVSSATKHARGGNRSPFQILRDAVETGNAADIELYWEFEQASLGRKKITWSNALREWAGLHVVEKTDGEIAAENRGGEPVLILPKATWIVVRHDVADLLDAVELGGRLAGQRWLRSRGLAFVVVEP